MLPNGPELIIVLVIVLVLFGPSRLPQLGKSIGKTMRSLREAMDGKPAEHATDAAGEKPEATEEDEAAGRE